MKIIDVSLPLKNKMWSYKDEWKNELSILSSTLESDLSTVYRFNICSHTGTYIETSQHKLRNNILLDQFDLTRFFCDVKVVVITLKIGHKCIFLDDFLFELKNNSLSLENGDSLIISCGWSNSHHEDKDFVIDAPFFDEKLTEYLMEQKLNLLGVDTPVIDNQKKKLLSYQ
jgi:kynurenine formamidase